MPLFHQHHAEAFDEGAFADTGNAGDAEAHGFSRLRKQPVHHGASQLPVHGVCAFDQGDGLGQDAAVAGADAVDIKFGITFTHC